MTTKVDGTNGIVFPDSTTQATAAISPKAWITFNGISGVSTLASYNCSATRNSTGDYTISFTSALSDANYAVVFGAQQPSASSSTTISIKTGTTPTSSSFTITTWNVGSQADLTRISIVVFR